MPRKIIFRRHSLKPKDNTPTGLSLLGAKQAIKHGRGIPRRAEYFASVSPRAQNTAALLSQRGKRYGKQQSVKVLENIGLEWTENPLGGLMDRTLFLMEKRLEAENKKNIAEGHPEKVVANPKDTAESHFAMAWIDGWGKDAVLAEFIGPEPNYRDPNQGYQEHRWGRKQFLKDKKAYLKMKEEYKDKLVGLPKSSEVAKNIMINAILPNLPQKGGVKRFFKKMLRPWQFLKRAPKEAQIVSHSYNVEAVIQYLTGVNVLADKNFKPGFRGNRLVNELEPLEFKVSPFNRKITMTYRKKRWDVTSQIRALERQQQKAA